MARRVARNRDGAWWQGLALGVAALALGVALWHAHERPFDRDTLGIAVSQLQSQAAEGEVLATQDTAHNVSAAFRGAHVQQMRQQLQRTRDELQQKDAPPDLGRARDDARRVADALDAALVHASRTAFDPAGIAVFRALSDQAGTLKDAVDPE
jgi:hypothetical protein